MVTMKNWKVFHWSDGTTRLNGEVYGYPGRPDGERVTTSRVIATKGRLISCYSRHYLLEGPPSAEYVQACEQLGKLIDDANPVKLDRE